MSDNNDKRELLKLRQGLIEEEESEILSEEKPNAYVMPKGKAAVENFFYHNKFYVIVAAFFAVVIAFLIFSIVAKEIGDIRILTIGTTLDASSVLFLKMGSIEEAFELYTPDFDGNGKIHVSNYFITLYENYGVAADTIHGNTIKLFGEMQEGEALIIMGDRGAFELIAGDTEPELERFFHNLHERYPDDPNVIDSVFYSVKGTPLALAAGLTDEESEDMFIAVRMNMGAANISEAKAAANLEKAWIVMDNIVSDNKINE
ncbi:MAG: hypothetical protein FWD34_05850 [Oscillospiraceae bacterium]|nr:hypothetical protein [Oscillospiraceae bacterium]